MFMKLKDLTALFTSIDPNPATISITALVYNIPNLPQQTKIKALTFTFIYIDLCGL